MVSRKLLGTLRSKCLGTLLAALTVSALVPSRGVAQIVMFSTAGTFSGGTGTTICSATQCTSDGFTLSFTGSGPANYLSPTLVDLGDFMTAFAPSGGTAGLTAFTGVNFVLTITQTAPAGGMSTFTDGISGTLAYNPSSSSLVWSPTVQTTTIGPVTYKLVLDNTGNFNINAPTIEAGRNPNSTSLKANITASTVPEPTTAMLLLPGLVGIGVVAGLRRRRR